MADSTKKHLGFASIILLLTVFVFGQLTRFNAHLGSRELPIHLLDIVVFISVVLFLSFFGNKVIFNRVNKTVIDFLVFTVFSFLFSIFIFKEWELLVGALYLIRILIYFLYAYLLAKFIFFFGIKREYVYKLLLAAIFVSAILGWYQYLIFPDLTFLKGYGWDDHYFRLVGTFLDPGFSGIIFTIGFLMSIFAFKQYKSVFYFFLALFFAVTTAFTFSRASYLAILAGGFFLFLQIREYKKYFLIFVFFLLAIVLLPRPGGEGVNLFRTFSIEARLINYTETISIWRESPLFGVGFNNLCLARIRIFSEGSLASHSCSGSDSSILLVFAATGVLGGIAFMRLLLELFKDSEGVYKELFKALMVSLMVHSLFVNSLFYPWVMVIVATFYALSVKD